MKRIQFIICMVVSVVAAANPTTNDLLPSNAVDESTVVKQFSKTTNECLPFARPVDCEEVRLNGNTASGVYTIWPRSRNIAYKSIDVYCDMRAAGGGWTVLQRRGRFGNAENYFNKTWEIYKHGFGELEKELWLGNEIIYALTNQGSYSVRFDMHLVNETSAYALYDQFWIKDEERKYQLHIAGYSGNAGDSMSYHHSMNFSTWDNDNDKHGFLNCAAAITGGWWFQNCALANLNGLNRKGKYTGSNNGIIWYFFTGFYESLEFSEIKIRPRHFR